MRASEKLYQVLHNEDTGKFEIYEVYRYKRFFWNVVEYKYLGEALTTKRAWKRARDYDCG